MKKSLISTVAFLMVVAIAFAAVAQQRRGAGRRPRMTQEQRLAAIKAVETQLTKLKTAPQMARPTGSFADMSEDERAKFREQMTKVRQEQQVVFQAILANVYKLQGRRAPEEEGVKYAIVSTVDLKAMQEAATKEQATETTQLIERMIARASGQRGGRGGQRGSRQ
jgi:hypothetical protein